MNKSIEEVKETDETLISTFAKLMEICEKKDIKVIAHPREDVMSMEAWEFRAFLIPGKEREEKDFYGIRIPFKIIDRIDQIQDVEQRIRERKKIVAALVHEIGHHQAKPKKYSLCPVLKEESTASCFFDEIRADREGIKLLEDLDNGSSFIEDIKLWYANRLTYSESLQGCLKNLENCPIYKDVLQERNFFKKELHIIFRGLVE